MIPRLAPLDLLPSLRHTGWLFRTRNAKGCRLPSETALSARVVVQAPVPQLVMLRWETCETPNYKGAGSPMRQTAGRQERDAIGGNPLVVAESSLLKPCHSVEKGWPQRKSFCILLRGVWGRVGSVLV